MSHTTVSAEHAIECPLAGAAWQADIATVTYTRDDLTLRVSARLLRLLPRSDERWHLCFTHCATFKFPPVGALGNERLTRPTRHTPYVSLPSVIYEIVNSEWLRSCEPVGGAPAELHHYVILDDTANMALHVAAGTVTGHRLEVGEELGAASQPGRSEALAEASERG